MSHLGNKKSRMGQGTIDRLTRRESAPGKEIAEAIGTMSELPQFKDITGLLS
ncbi:hypothetical protein LCGC14_2841440, partial [marine sediment metagenome]